MDMDIIYPPITVYYHTGIHAQVERWTKTAEMDGDYIEK